MIFENEWIWMLKCALKRIYSNRDGIRAEPIQLIRMFENEE